ncbi:MAG: PTS sugar transporter subunit IIA [Selenomonadaceae bacterium]|nr:PTS sugar transporter subunit IIA [Selenomonadaceae bacterium]
MFKEMVEKKHYTFQQGFSDWKEAVRAACQPLLADGTIDDIYPEEIIKKVEELGPYIVIAPDICIPHAQEGLGVHETAISFMKTETPVRFSDDGEHDARLFFVLASTDNAVHLKNLGDMAEALSDDDLVAKLLQAKTPEELVALED